MFVIIGGTSAVIFVIGEFIRVVMEGEIMKAIGELKKSKQVDGISRHTHLIGKTILDLRTMAEGNLLVISLLRSDGRMLHSGFLEEK